MTELAVVLITKNQEWNVARLIESALEFTSGVASREIVLVDSASTDKTIDIARRHPIRILRLRPDQRLTPAAGRYIGYKHTSGDKVLFLDGDMELCNVWLERALTVFENTPDVAAVSGLLIDLPKSTPPGVKVDFEQTMYGDAVTEVLYVGGAAIYRRAVLEQVGTFNPYLHSDEEPEICLRIRHAGYRLLRIEYPIAFHYSDPREDLSTSVSYWRRSLYLGTGQNIRYLLGSKSLWPYIRERGYGCLPALAMAAGLASFLWSIATHKWDPFGLWVLLLLVIVAGDSYRKRSFYRTCSSLLHRMFEAAGMVRGFLMKPMSPDEYPSRFDVIK